MAAGQGTAQAAHPQPCRQQAPRRWCSQLTFAVHDGADTAVHLAPAWLLPVLPLRCLLLRLSGCLRLACATRTPLRNLRVSRLVCARHEVAEH